MEASVFRSNARHQEKVERAYLNVADGNINNSPFELLAVEPDGTFGPLARHEAAGACFVKVVNRAMRVVWVILRYRTVAHLLFYNR